MNKTEWKEFTRVALANGCNGLQDRNALEIYYAFHHGTRDQSIAIDELMHHTDAARITDSEATWAAGREYAFKGMKMIELHHLVNSQMNAKKKPDDILNVLAFQLGTLFANQNKPFEVILHHFISNIYKGKDYDNNN
jgi:hypothetical protein